MLTVADKTELSGLIAGYNVAIDTGDGEASARTFGPDGVCDGIVGRFEGRAEIADFARRYRSDPEYGDFRSSRQWVSNVLIEDDGDEATLRADHQMVQPTGTGGPILLVGVCDDLPRRVDGEWLFARRRVRAHDDPDARRGRAGAGHTRQGPT